MLQKQTLQDILSTITKWHVTCTAKSLTHLMLPMNREGHLRCAMHGCIGLRLYSLQASTPVATTVSLTAIRLPLPHMQDILAAKDISLYPVKQDSIAM
jgi:hypothetical protein